MKSKATKSEKVAETMDEIEGSLIEGLDGRRYDTIQDLSGALSQAADRYVQTSKLERVDSIRPLDPDDFAEWVRAGDAFGFIALGSAANRPDDGQRDGSD